MIYDIRLSIAYAYATPAAGGRHVLCMMPKDDATQRLLAGLIEIEPKPDERGDHVDFFGNRITEFSYRSAHDSVSVTLKARVDRVAQGRAGGPSVALHTLPQVMQSHTGLGPDSPLHYIAPSGRVPRDAEMTRFVKALIRPDMTVADLVMALGHALHTHMTFDPDATEVDTPATEAFAKRHGVCQDFSHIMIACLRGVGVPAGYVSGFLRTTPPPGKPRLEGADAMHAWVRAWCGPDAGWVEFDPTNDVQAGVDHVVVARGRDYTDVAPIKGAMRLSGGQKSHQSVDMIQVGG